METPLQVPHTGTVVSLDLSEMTAKRALGSVLQATALRRKLLASRDDSRLSKLLGTTHHDMISSATHRRGMEAVSRQSEHLQEFLQRPGSRMATLSRMEGGEVGALATSRGLDSTTPREGGRNSPFRLPSSPRRSRELQQTLTSVFMATAEATQGNVAGSAALDAQWPSQGLGRAQAQQRA